jgi:choline dehydrogenase-like flavoprotein
MSSSAQEAVTQSPVPAQADVVIAGTGFASSFFLLEYLKTAPRNARVVVFERGSRFTHQQRLREPEHMWSEAAASFVNRTPHKHWTFSLGFGGSSNCWWACVPRFLPEDFELHSRYGVGRDWPLSYAELEPFYDEVEDVMAVAGPAETPFPRRRAYPQPAHSFSEVDERLARRYPGRFFAQPSARPTRAVGARPACCGSGVCDLCPIDAKFTIANAMAAVYADPRVVLVERTSVERLELTNQRVAAVEWGTWATRGSIRADLVVLGCNALFNPWLLLRSGLKDAHVGRYLVEQVGVEATLGFEGRRLRLGSTSISGHGYMFYAGEHRRERPAALLESYSVPGFKVRDGKWLQEITLKLVLEDLPLEASRVELGPDNRPVVTYGGPSDYSKKGIEHAKGQLEELASTFPEARLTILGPQPAEAHVIGTTVMSRNADEGVVDPGLVHHRVRNLVVLGSGAFPTAPPANPTLTLSALALRAARRLASSRGGDAAP